MPSVRHESACTASSCGFHVATQTRPTQFLVPRQETWKYPHTVTFQYSRLGTSFHNPIKRKVLRSALGGFPRESPSFQNASFQNTSNRRLGFIKTNIQTNICGPFRQYSLVQCQQTPDGVLRRNVATMTPQEQNDGSRQQA